MATSGSNNFNPDRNELLKGSLRLCGVIGEGDNTESADINDASMALNLIAKSWMSDGMQVWLQDKVTIFTENNKQSYDLNSTGDHASSVSYKTEVKVAAIALATTIDVDDTTDMVVSDNIGFELDDGTMHWTTISSIPDSDTVVIATGLVSASAIDNHVYWYTTKLAMPYKITDIWRRDENDNDVPMIRLTREEYVSLSLKSSTGKTNNFFYDRQLENGILHVWPVSTTVRDRILAYVHREVFDFDTATDTPDFPKYYHRALKFAVAADIGIEHGLPNSRINLFEQKALYLKEEASQYDIEDGSVYMEIG